MATTRLAIRPRVPIVGDPAALDPRVRKARASLPTALVNLPFVSCTGPSIQIGLLKAIAASHGFPVRTFHLNLDFACLLGREFYEELCDYGRSPVGDWLWLQSGP